MEEYREDFDATIKCNSILEKSSFIRITSDKQIREVRVNNKYESDNSSRF